MDPLFQPLTVNGLQLRNRVYSAAHAPTGYLEDGVPGERYVAYHEAKARGGAALTIVGGSSNVSVDSADVFSNFYCGGRESCPSTDPLSDRVHAHGTAVMVQITHLGRRSKSDVVKWLPTVAPSAVREHAHRSYREGEWRTLTSGESSPTTARRRHWHGRGDSTASRWPRWLVT